MKKGLIAILLLITFHASLKAQNVGINTTSPAASAALDITATDKGLLIPRMTTTQRTGISSPATGLLVFDTTLGQFYFYSSTGWTAIPLSTSSALSYIGTSYLGKTSGAGSTGTSEGTSSNLYNIAIGANALNANTTANNSVALGQNALKANTTASNNIALGQNALQSVNGFAYYSQYPDIAIGYNTLKSNNYAGGNIAIGYQSQQLTNGDGNTTGVSNTSLGSFTLRANTEGNGNVAVGVSSLLNNSTGNYNTGLGVNALSNNTTGYNNTAVGLGAGTTSIFNSTVANTTGSNNTFLGAYAGAGSSDLLYATAIGYAAKVNTSNSVVLGGTGTYAVNVGIGTASPSQTLDVAGTTKTTNFQMTNGATNGYVLQCDASGNATWATIASASVLAGNGLSYSGNTLNSTWTSANGGILYNNTGSRIGLATTNPYCLLANTSTNIYGADGQGLNAYSLGWSQAATGYTGAFFNSSTSAVAQGLAVKIAGTSSTNRLLDLSTDIQSDYAGTSVMVVQGDGKVGIGTASPSYKLDIQTSGSNAVANVQSSTNAAYVSTTSPSANEAAIKFNTYTSNTTAPTRWIVGKGSSTETGSNAGADFFINRYDDAGLYKGQPLSISRQNGTVTVGNDGVSTTANSLKINGAVSVSTTVQSGSYTLSGTDYCAIFIGSTGTFTLPTASTCTGRIYLIVNQGTASLTTSSYRTSSSTTLTSIAMSASVQVISDGTEWRKVN